MPFELHNTGSGDWKSVGTWNPARLPNTAAQVVLDAFGDDVTVTLTGVADVFGTTIRNQNTLALNNAKLNNAGSGRTQMLIGFSGQGTLLAQTGSNEVWQEVINYGVGRFGARGGTIQVASDASLWLVESYTSTGGLLQVDDGGSIRFSRGSVFNGGLIELSSNGKATKLTTSSSTLTLTGGGRLSLSDSVGNLIDANVVNLDNFIFGAGTISGRLDNQASGIIQGGGAHAALVLDIKNGLSKNSGRIEAVQGGLVIGNIGVASRLENTGFITAASSTLLLARVDLINTGGNVTASGPLGLIKLQDSKISGGDVTTAVGTSLLVLGSSTLNGVAFHSNGALNVGSGAFLRLTGGTNSIRGDVTDDGRIVFDSEVVLQGGKSVTVDGSLTGDSRLTNVDDMISGTGVIKVGVLSNKAKGQIAGDLRITADQLGNAGSISLAHITSTLATNTGTMTGVSLKANSFDNSGSVSDAVLDIPVLGSITNQAKGTIANSRFGETAVSNFGVVRADAGQTTFSGTQLVGGTLASSSGGALRTLANPDRATLLKVDKVASDTTFAFDDGSSATLQATVGTLTLDSVTILLNGARRPTSLALAGSVKLQGASHVSLGDFTQGDFAGNLLTIGKLTNVSSTIEGAGEISGEADSSLNNGTGGTIKVEGKNSLTVKVGQLTNDGVLEADGGTLTVKATDGIRGGGFVEVTDGGTVDLLGAKSFRGSFAYVGRGSIIGPQTAPAGTISGFATGDKYTFGATSNFSGPLTAIWQENASNTGGTLSIKVSPTQTYATLQFAGVYTSSDFTAIQDVLADGKHVAVAFTGHLSWAAPVSGNWQTARNWNPTGQFVPGQADDVLITVAGGPYRVTDSVDTTVRSVATGEGVTLDIKDGNFTTSMGTASVANAGTVDIRAGASFTIGGTFQQASTGRIVADGAAAAVALAGGATVAGGRIVLADGGTLNAASGLPTLSGVAISNKGAINVAGKTKLALTGSTVTGDGSVTVAQGATLALASSSISGNVMAMAGTLEIDSTTVLNSSVTLEAGRVVTGGSPATLSNRGRIEGTGTIGDANLTLFNLGTIQQGGNGLTISTGANTVDNSGSMFTSSTDGLFRILSAFNNSGTFRATDRGTGQFAGAVTNTRLMEAEGTGPNSDATLDFRGTLANSHVVSAMSGSTIRAAGQITQTKGGQIELGGRSRLLLNTGAGISGGKITLSDQSRLQASPDSGTVTIQQATLSLTDSSELRIDNLTLVGTKVEMDTDSSALVQSNRTLTVQDSTLTGGTYFVRGGITGSPGQLRLGGKVQVNGATLQVAGGNIVSNGAAASLINAGTILGRSGTVGDGNLTLVNNGTITADAGSGITLATGNNVIVNNATIATSSGGTSKIMINSTLRNSSTGQLLASRGSVVASQVENAGLIQASRSTTDHSTGTGFIQIATLVNTGQVVAKEGSTVTAFASQNTGMATATGKDSTLNLGNDSHVATNRGQIVASDHGEVRFDGGVSNGSGGQLTAQSGGKVVVVGAATGGIAKIVGDGSVIDFEGSAGANTTTNAVFDDTGLGQLMLNHSDRFAGTVAGFAAGDKIDVEDVAFVAGKSSYNASTGILTVSDGDTHMANIQLLGAYISAAFTFKSDGHGGTLVTGTASADPPSLMHHILASSQ